MTKVSLAAILIILSALILVNCGDGEEGASKEAIQPAETVDSVTIEQFGLEGKTALDLLAEKYVVRYKWTNSGVFIKEIDSVANGDGWFWTYTVNDSLMNLSADRCSTSNGDRIVWHFRKQ